jgi:trans-aconitate methyltransferase
MEPMLAAADAWQAQTGVSVAWEFRSLAAFNDQPAHELAPGFDLITSHIVFQHIPTATGYELLARVAGLLAPGGVAVVQFSLRPASWLAPAFYGVLRTVPPARRLWNLARRRRPDFPFMEMNSYRLERLLAVLHADGIGDVSVRFAPARHRADHAQATLTFARPPVQTPRSARA